MFATDDSPGPLTRLVEYFLHLVVVGFVAFPLSLIFDFVLPLIGLNGYQSPQVSFVGYVTVSCFFASIAGGWYAGRTKSGLISTGRWIWIAPAVTVVPEMVREAFRSQPVPWLPGYFFMTGSNEGVGGLITISAFSVIGYSIGMILVDSKPKWTAITRMIPVPNFVTIAIIWIVLFGTIILLAHRFEQSRIEMWGRIRTVIGHEGIVVAQDPRQICPTIAPNAGSSVPSGMMVEGLEDRVCENGANSFHIERVRVLNGPKAGTVGWAPSYGLRNELRP